MAPAGPTVDMRTARSPKAAVLPLVRHWMMDSAYLCPFSAFSPSFELQPAPPPLLWRHGATVQVREKQFSLEAILFASRRVDARLAESRSAVGILHVQVCAA